MVIPHLREGGTDIWADTALSAMMTAAAGIPERICLKPYRVCSIFLCFTVTASRTPSSELSTIRRTTTPSPPLSVPLPALFSYIQGIVDVCSNRIAKFSPSRKYNQVPRRQIKNIDNLFTFLLFSGS